MNGRYCRYELDQAKQRLLERNDDSLVILRIDDVDLGSLPEDLLEAWSTMEVIMKNLIGKKSSLNFSGFLTNTNVKAQKAMIPKYPCLNQSTEMFSKMDTKLPKWPLRQLVLLMRDKAPTTITNNSNIYFLLEALWIFAGSRRCSFY